MSFTLEDFARIARLNPAELLALRRITENNDRMALAREIADKCFIAPQAEPLPKFPESPELAEAWFGAAWLSLDASREHYWRRGIPRTVWLDSMTDLRLWLQNELRNRGTIGLGPLGRPWQAALYRGDVTRHGRLECNSEFFYRHETLRDEHGQELLAPGDAVINLHIPEDGPMDFASCGASMRRMAEFFACWKPHYEWKGFLCESWLLDRQLHALLPARSNILKFQTLGRHYPTGEPSDAVFRIFGYAAPESVVNPTTLQQSAAKFLREGGKFVPEGMFIPREAVEEVDFDLAALTK